MTRARSDIEIDASADLPLFAQIAAQLRRRIRSGAWPAGHRLPTLRALADELGTHRNTVARAYEELAEQGLVRSTVGRGTFVAEVVPSDAPGSGDEADIDTSAARHDDTVAQASSVSFEPLLSRAARSEALTRADRVRREMGERTQSPIDLTRLEPSASLLPVDPFRRCVDHTLRTHGADALGYVQPQGLPRLRARLVEDLARLGVPARAEDIVITTGSQQALDLVARALIDPGDPFLVENETYTGAINALSVAGAHLIPVPADADGPKLDATERHVGTAKGFYLMPNCRNPTGGTIVAARRRELVDWSRRTGVPLIEDDYGADLQLDDQPPPAALRSLDPDVIYISTFSKRLIPALRVGLVVAPPTLRRTLIALKRATDLGTSILLQHALAEFLERGYLQTHLREVLPEYRRRRDTLEEALDDQLATHGVRWTPMRHGLVTWLELPAGLRADEVFAEAQRHGVWVSPATLHSPSGRAQSGLRLTIAREPPERIAEGVRRLGRALEEVSGRADRGNAAIPII